MPQLSSNFGSTAGPQNPDLTSREVMEFLNELYRDLDGEVCAALLEENNKLAERLMVPLQKVKKLTLALQKTAQA